MGGSTLATMATTWSTQVKAVIGFAVLAFAAVGVFMFLYGISKLRHIGNPQMSQQVNLGNAIAMVIVGAILAGGGIWFLTVMLGSMGATGAATPSSITPSL